ncbi:MAG: hypothetical protein CSA66_03850 [Proteobacteria bacterium]|nr:MAG: hypothetical protein CSA66_03850 [Pseudomonadota bacterium]
MALSTDPAKFVLPPEIAKGIEGKRVFITGSGKDRGLGQAFALSAGMSGAASVAVHFHSSYDDGLDTVQALRKAGCNAFPVQCDVTNPRDVWGIRSYVVDRMGGVPNLIICNSGLSESGYLLGRPPRDVEGETQAHRRARVRQAFVKNLGQSARVVSTKVDGFLSMTHLWASEAVYAGDKATFVYISSRQAHDPGAGVPGYVAANWAVLSLPKILRLNLGKRSSLINALSVGYPFVRTGMTEAYADNPKVFGRWQPRMLEPYEASMALMQLLNRPHDELDDRFFQVLVDKNEALGERGVDIRWSEVKVATEEAGLAWSDEAPLSLEGAK